MQTGVSSLKRGVGDLVGSLLSGGATAQDAYAKELERLERAEATRQQGRKYRLEGDVLQDQVGARTGLGDSLAAILAEQGGDPALGSHYSTAYRAAGGNASNLGDLLVDLTGLRRQNEAINLHATDPAAANVRLAASGRTPYTPFSQSPGGLVIDEATGRQVQDSPAAQETIGAIAALAADRRASADAASALAESRRNPQPGAGGSGGSEGAYKASDANAMHRYTAELMGGTFDPVTNRIMGIDRSSLPRMTAIAARAEEIYQRSGGLIGHINAVRQAAAEFGVPFPAAAGVSPEADPAAAGLPDPRDPGGIRRWLLGE